MTLLITAVGKGFFISSSDTRVTTKTIDDYIPMDERFNKHVAFFSHELRGNITFTGIAEWQEDGRVVRMYDLIAESVKASIDASVNIGTLSCKLAADILVRLWTRKVRNPKKEAVFEFHVVAWHAEVPDPIICVVSTFRNVRPWFAYNDCEVEKKYEGFYFYMKFADVGEVVFGGASSCVSKQQKEKIFNSLAYGANGFQASQLMSKTIFDVSRLSNSVGSRSVSMAFPRIGPPDTNVWDKRDDTILGFMPLTIFPKGVTMGPSEFPIDLSLVLNGRLAPHSLFFKTVLAKHLKLSDRRRAFRMGRGKFIPGIYDLIFLGMFGTVSDGYTDLGFGADLEQSESGGDTLIDCVEDGAS